MIETIRKFRGLLVLGLALVIVGLVLGLKEDLFRGGIGGQSVYRIEGRTYTDREYNRLGTNGLELAKGLGMYLYVMNLSETDNFFSTQDEQATENFFVNRMLLRDTARELGIAPDDARITERIKEMPVFAIQQTEQERKAGKPREFSEETYRNVIDRGIGRLGLTEADLRELVADDLCYEKISGIIGAGLEENRSALAADIALDRQQISSVMIKLDIAKHRDAIQPTDEQLKAFWDEKITPFLQPLPKNADGSDDDSAIGASEKEVRSTYTTEPTRKFTYLVVTPEAAVAPEEPVDDAPATEGQSDEEKKRIAEEKAKAAYGRARKLAEDKRSKQREADAKVDDFATRLEERKGEGFEALAAEFVWTVATTDLFKQAAPPKELLDLKLRATSSTDDKVTDELFKLKPTADPLSKITQPIAVGENQWFVARLDGEEPSRPKTFDESKEQVREQYIREKAIEALEKEAEELKARLQAAIDGGKSFDEATSEAGINRTHSVLGYNRSHNRSEETDRLTREITELSEQINNMQPPLEEQALAEAKTKLGEKEKQLKNAEEARDMAPVTLFENTRNVTPGKLAEIVYEPEDSPTAAHLIQVMKREVVKTQGDDNFISTTVSQSGQQNARIALKEWLASQREAADVVPLFRR
jgi:hypothetical protein